ncbi:MAG: polyphosphate polymerase domain-containing protein [Bacteroidota bacterium]
MSGEEQILGEFEPIGLEDISGVRLMDRIDTKYTFHESWFPEVLKRISRDYFVLTVASMPYQEYHTVYFDTPDRKMYTAHHNGKLNRYKVRKRIYLNSDIAFVEVKFKDNKGKTSKRRILTRNFTPTLNDEEKNFLKEQIPFDPGTLTVSAGNSFKRITLVNRDKTERATLDFDIKLICDEGEQEMQNLIVAEIKRDKYAYSSKIARTLESMKITSSSMSKYCMAVAYLGNQIKQNRFKEQLITFNHIRNDLKSVANS